MQDGSSQPAEVFRTDETVLIDETTRKALSVSVPDEASSQVSAVLEALTPELSAFFRVPLTRYEEPQFLRYEPGAFFAPHRDRPTAEGLATSDRKISLVLFLNDNYEGGRLTFFDLVDEPGFAGTGFPCDPTPGLAVAFRSTTMHEVTPVTSGERFTIVTWYA